MEKIGFHHALKIRTDVCIGCAHCMRACPTEALRVIEGKAHLHANRCIDCGECYRVCPTGAIIVEQDDFQNIFNYKRRVALIPSVLLGQYPDNVTPGMVIQALKNIGFTDVFEVEDSVEYLIPQINEYIAKNQNKKPIISSFCPAIVRLVQVKFPWLVGNILLIRPPLDLTASYIRGMLTSNGVSNNDVGIFYITPCAAKIAAIKSPVGEEFSELNGVINMDLIYNRTLHEIKKKNVNKIPNSFLSDLSARSITWALTNGEAVNIDGRCMAIDGIHNVIEFLEKIENDEVNGVDFLELRACDESCAGGILAAANRFITAELLRNHAKQFLKPDQSSNNQKKLQKYEQLLMGKINLNRVEPRSMVKLDEDMAKAMKKMERVKRLMCYLPGVDCGVCGAPSCLALAEDIVQGEGAISHCVFLQKIMEQNKLDPEHSFRIMKKIWGTNRFYKDCDKPIQNK
ncbi:MAG TPA: [Fe-Fe] hydrogenase large subunit C-terminal domain-containing protein [Tenuifilaceae bacterium]|nr:[Fe-Fe] hydrogenase large subunit C-terminal domain-containing protein [Tenuifilaceae bacterium]